MANGGIDMNRRFWSLAALALLAGTLVVLTPGESQAQRRGFGGFGRGFGGGYGGYGGYGGLGYGGLGYGGYGGYGLGYGRSGYGGYGLGYGGYGYGGYGGYGGYAYSPSYYNSYPSYSYATPSYSGDYYYGGSPSITYNQQPTTAYQSFYPSNVNQGNTAVVHVRVPADAEVWFDDTPTQQRGPMREFQTPPLESGKTYTYQVRAKWSQGGQMMDRTLPCQVRAGQPATLDFTSAAAQQPQQVQPPVDQQPAVRQKQPEVK